MSEKLMTMAEWYQANPHGSVSDFVAYCRAFDREANAPEISIEEASAAVVGLTESGQHRRATALRVDCEAIEAERRLASESRRHRASMRRDAILATALCVFVAGGAACGYVAAFLEAARYLGAM